MNAIITYVDQSGTQTVTRQNIKAIIPCNEYTSIIGLTNKVVEVVPHSDTIVSVRLSE